MKFSFALIIPALLLVIGCSQDKIPVTTSSDEALENFLIGRDLVEKIRHEDASEYLEKAVSLDPDFALAHLYLAFTKSSINQTLEHIRIAKSHIDKVSEGERLWILAVDTAASGASQEHKSYLQELVEMYPNDERAVTQLGSYYYGQREYKKSLVYYKRAIEINPSYPQSYNMMGYAYRFLEDYPAAEESFKKYINLIPDDPNPYDSYAELLLKMGEFEVSIETYEKALEIDPDFYHSYNGIASNLIYMRQYNQARSRMKHLSKIAVNDRQRRLAYYVTAITYIAEGDLEKGLIEIEKFSQFAENDADTLSIIKDRYLTAEILAEFGRLEETEAQLAHAKKLIEVVKSPTAIKDNFKRAYLYRLSQVAIKKGDLNLAREYANDFRRLAELIDNKIELTYYYTLSGLIAFADKNYDEAITEYQQSNLDDPYNQYRLALAYSANGETDNAIEQFENAVNYNGLVSINYVLIRQRSEKQLSRLRSS